jgi:hypothetical protein
MVFGMTNPFVAKSNNGDDHSIESSVSADDTSTLHYENDDDAYNNNNNNNSRRSILRRRHHGGHGHGRHRGRHGHIPYRRNFDRTVSWCDTLDDIRTYDTDNASASWTNPPDARDELLHRAEQRDDDTHETNDDPRYGDDDDTLDTNEDSSRDDDTCATNDAASSCDDDDDDTYATNDDSRAADTFETDLAEEEDDDDVILDFDSIYPGDTRMSYGLTQTYSEAHSSGDTMISVSREDDCIEIEHVDAEDRHMIRPGEAMEARRTSRGEDMRSTATSMKQIPSSPSPPPPPPPPPSANVMCPPKSIGRKQLAEPPTPTPISMLKRIGTDDITIGPYEEEAVNDIEQSRVFVPKLIDLPMDELVIDDVSTMDSGSTLESLSYEENGVDGICDDIAGTVGLSSPVSNGDRTLFSFDAIPSWDESRIRKTGGSDDTSMRSLTKTDHDFIDMFKIQKRADTLAGHIGLILPFWRGRKGGENEPPSKNSTSCEGGTDAIVERRDFMTKKISLPSPAKTLQSNTSTYLSKEVSVKSPYSENDYYDNVKILPGQSTDGAQSDDGGYMEDSQSMNDDGGVPRNEDGKGSNSTKNFSNDSGDISSPHQRIVSGRVISAESIRNKKQSINEFDIENDQKMQGIFDTDDFVPIDSSSGMESNSDESELSTYAVTPAGELIPIQDLGVSKKYTKMRSIQTQTGEGGIPLYLRDDFMDQITLDILKMSNDHQPKEKRKQWPWVWKKNSKKDHRCSGLDVDGRHQPIPLDHRSNRVSDKFEPKELSSGRVNDDDYSCSASCVSADSILTELKVIENTAKLMYQKVILGDSGDMGPSKNYIAALFSPEETELVLKTRGAVSDVKCEQPAHHQEEAQKGGVFSKILGRSSSRKTRKFGPVFGVSASWTPK